MNSGSGSKLGSLIWFMLRKYNNIMLRIKSEYVFVIFFVFFLILTKPFLMHYYTYFSAGAGWPKVPCGVRRHVIDDVLSGPGASRADRVGHSTLAESDTSSVRATIADGIIFLDPYGVSPVVT